MLLKKKKKGLMFNVFIKGWMFLNGYKNRYIGIS